MPLHIHEYGPEDGHPLLALHGVTGHGERWKSLAERHLAGFRVIAPDLRGHGRSPYQPPWTLEQHAADLLAVIDNYRLPSVAVLGHSFGGAIALHLARLAPQRVSKLLLLDPVVGADPELALQRAEQPHQAFSSREDAAKAKRYDWPAASEEVIDAELDAHLYQVDGALRFRYCPSAVITAWSEMARVAVLPDAGTPTLLMPALRAEYHRPEFVQACRIALQDDLTVSYLDGGHVLYVECPSEVGDLVRGFAMPD